MTRLLLAIPLFAATAFDTVHGQVEYQHFDGFSVLSEPSPLPEGSSKEPVRMENILILRDSDPKEAPADKQPCLFLDTNTSITWETADAIPVMYVYRKCGRTVEMTYRDLSGREWRQSQLVPLQRETFSKTLSKLDDVEPGDDAEARIAAYAICKGIVPKPDWFDATCDRQPRTTSQ
jgi:hypothetical protein